MAPSGSLVWALVMAVATLTACGGKSKKKDDAPAAGPDVTATGDGTAGGDTGGTPSDATSGGDSTGTGATGGTGTTTGTTSGGDTTGTGTTGGASGTGSGTTGGTAGTGTTTGTDPQPDPFGQSAAANVESVQKTVIDPYCVGCHGTANPKAGLNLTDLKAFLPGAAASDAAAQYRGKLFTPGSPETSLLVARLKAPDEFRMPPKASDKPRVKDQQIAAIEKWIKDMPAQGGTLPPIEDGDASTSAPAPGPAPAPAPAPTPEPAPGNDGEGETDIGLSDTGDADDEGPITDDRRL